MKWWKDSTITTKQIKAVLLEKIIFYILCYIFYKIYIYRYIYRYFIKFS